MLRPRARDRAGFKFIELLVLVLVIGVLVMMAIPVIHVNPVRASTRECSDNMRRVSQALLQYELTHRHYPGYSNVLLRKNGSSYVDPVTGQKHGVSYIVALLPYLDRPDLDRAWRTPVTGKPNHLEPKIEVRFLECPEDPPTLADTAALSYVVNCGMKDIAGTPAAGNKPGVPRDWAANGVFFDLYSANPRVDGVPSPKPGEPIEHLSAFPSERLAKDAPSDKVGIFAENQPGLPLVGMSNDYISRHDGIAQTVQLSENVDAGEYTDFTEAKVGLVWDATGKLDPAADPPTLKPPDDNMRISVGTGASDLADAGSSETIFARPSSFHPRGVNMAFCDGKVRFVSDQMDYYVYCLLMSSNGAAARLPGSEEVLPHFDVPLRESWYMQ